MKILFTKMHGAGNDYIYINGFEVKIGDEEKPELVRKLSDRHFGIGGDGVIFINPGHTPIGMDAGNGQKAGDPAQFEMEMYNLDGSRGEMCGNGIRCVGKYVYDHDMIPGVDRAKDESAIVTIESAGAVKVLTLYPENGRVKTARVDMGEPILTPALIPTDPGKLACTEEGVSSAAASSADAPIINAPVKVAGRIYHVTAVSMGNPHAVVFAEELDLPDGDLAKWNILSVGPAFEVMPLYPKKTNTEFVKVLDRGHVAMRVYERGSGETLACGTGCCATGVACVLNGRTDRKIEVQVLGGRIEIEWDEKTNHVFMTGPAATAFEGVADTDIL